MALEIFSLSPVVQEGEIYFPLQNEMAFFIKFLGAKKMKIGKKG